MGFAKEIIKKHGFAYVIENSFGSFVADVEYKVDEIPNVVVTDDINEALIYFSPRAAILDAETCDKITKLGFVANKIDESLNRVGTAEQDEHEVEFVIMKPINEIGKFIIANSDRTICFAGFYEGDRTVAKFTTSEFKQDIEVFDNLDDACLEAESLNYLFGEDEFFKVCPILFQD